MNQQAFTKLEQNQIQPLLDQINAETQGADFDIDSISLLKQDTSFYPDWTFFDLTDHSTVPHRRMFYLHHKDKFIPLNWTHEQIYELNHTIPIDLNDSNIVDYVRFFLVFAKGEHGRFLLIESIDDLNWSEQPLPTAKQAISTMLKILGQPEIDANKNWNFDATILLKDSLFRCHISVCPAGEVTINNEELLIESLPIIDDSIGQ